MGYVRDSISDVPTHLYADADADFAGDPSNKSTAGMHDHAGDHTNFPSNGQTQTPGMCQPLDTRSGYRGWCCGGTVRKGSPLPKDGMPSPPDMAP